MDAQLVLFASDPCDTHAMSSPFWERVTEAFADAGLETSQSGIARELDVGQSAVQKWAKGTGYPTLRKCIQIAKRTGVSVEWLLTGRGNKNPKGGSMDDLTQALLDLWASLTDEAKADILAYLKFRASGSGEQH